MANESNLTEKLPCSSYVILIYILIVFNFKYLIYSMAMVILNQNKFHPYFSPSILSRFFFKLYFKHILYIKSARKSVINFIPFYAKIFIYYIY